MHPRPPTSKSIKFINALLTTVAILLFLSLALSLYIVVNQSDQARLQAERNEVILNRLADNQQTTNCILSILPEDRSLQTMENCLSR